MHELSIVQSLVERVQEEAARHGATAVHRLHLRVGAMSGVLPELLQTAFEVFREGTICAGAELEIARVPVVWSCPACGVAVEVGGPLRCGSCGDPVRLTAGDELHLDRIEMEVPDV